MMGDTASALHQAVLGVFAPEGPLAKVDTHFKPREGQTAMAMAVADTLLSGGALVVEAGTGVGKTFAYLVPALLSGERVVISTATKTL
jgi:ATP-dependent DNA helicase DinG